MDVILFRDHGRGVWMASKDGRTEPTAHTVQLKAGDVVDRIKATMPGVRIGVKSTEFGPAVIELCRVRTGGDVVWMK